MKCEDQNLLVFLFKAIKTRKLNDDGSSKGSFLKGQYKGQCSDKHQRNLEAIKTSE